MGVGVLVRGAWGEGVEILGIEVFGIGDGVGVLGSEEFRDEILRSGKGVGV